MLPISRPALLAVALLACTLARGAAWPEAKSDLPGDPEVHWGTLPNGLRYAVRRNAEPKGRVSLRLLVAAGSIYERESERGIAHYIEHMAFRGTREHPNGGMTTELQRLGVGFGPDTAAFTFWDHTIYQLELPDTTEATLREGLGVFREYATDITFDTSLIIKERDVIMNERDTRNTPDMRTSNANLQLLWPESVQVRRLPIGLAVNIMSFTREQMISFYNAWYRPERMVVIAVGDIDPESVSKLITSIFSGVRARGPERPDLIDPVPATAGAPTIRVFTDSGIPGAGCTIEHPFKEAASPDTHERRVMRLRRALAFAMLQHRAARLSKAKEGVFVVPQASVNSPVPGWEVSSFGASGTIRNWKTFMESLELEQRSAYVYGFTAAELGVARTSFESYYADSVRTSATWHSDWVAGSIANSIVQGEVFSTPAQIQADIAADLAATKPEDCLAEYRRAWTTGPRHVFVRANPSFNVTAEEIAEELNSGLQTPPVKPVDKPAVAFPYTNFGPPGQLVESNQVKDLDVWEGRFANGVRLNFKRTSFEAGSVVVAVRVGTGRLSQPASKPGLDLYANAVVPFGGLGKLSVEDLQEALASRAISVSFAVDSDALDFGARCAPQDLGMCLKVIAAHLTDTGYREDAIPQVQASMGSMYSTLAASPAGPITMLAPRILSGGDTRFGVATPAEIGSRTIAEVRQWLEPQLKHGAIELSIVGDTTWDAATAEVAGTLGALPQRDERPAGGGFQYLTPVEKPSKPGYLYMTEPSLRQVALSRYCLIPDLKDVHMERRCRLLAAILAERMRVKLRMELGASYGFDADFVSNDGFPDFNFFGVTTNVAREHARKADELIDQEIESLRRGHITRDEFQRVKAPFISKREEDLRDNGYWGYTVLRDAQQRPERLDAARDRQSDCESIKQSEIEDLAARYFKRDRWFHFVAFPRDPSILQAPVQGFK